MKEILKQLIESDNTYNKSATRYLYKNNPELWQWILSETDFLPANAKPKQRIWHILNEVYIRPKCPITGEFVKWWENRYLFTSSRSARTTLLNLNGTLNNQTLTARQKRKTTINDGFKTGRIRPKVWSDEESAARYEKIRKATEEKYGVHSTLLVQEVRDRQYKTKIEKGLITPKEQKHLRQVYYEAVLKFTKDSWKSHFDKINPKALNRSEYDLDHIYSIQQGWRDGIPPYIIGHWTNLRMLEPTKNYSKGMRCDKTKEMLFEDFFKSDNV